MMKIYDLRTSLADGRFKLAVSFQSQRLGAGEVWFSAPEQYAGHFCTTRMDGFLVGMLFPAMQYGEDIHLGGCVSEKLLFNINNYVVPLLRAFSPACRQIKVTADETCAERLNGHGVGIGFSGGVDSFSTVHDRFVQETPPGYRINSLLFMNVGSHGGWAGDGGGPESARCKFMARYRHLKGYADEAGLPFMPLDSNLHAFHPWGHLKTCVLTSAAGALVLQAHYSKYYYASPGVDYVGLLVELASYKGMSLEEDCEPVLLPLLSTESLELIPDGHPYTRVQKISRILDYEPVRRYLNVCIGGGEGWENCSACDKCCRTMMTLDLLGRLEQFRQVFDVDRYRKKEVRRYVCEQMLLCDKDPYARQNIELARRHGVKIPGPVVYQIIGNAFRLHHFVGRMLGPHFVSVVKKMR